MNAKQWRKQGYKVIFRFGSEWFGSTFAILYRPATQIAIATPVRNGFWMQFDNVNKWPWINITDKLTEKQADNLRKTAEDCYCDCGGGISNCDFCTGRR